MLRKITLIGMVALTLALVGCGGGGQSTTESAATTAEEAPAQAATPAVITLPDGWAISDVITEAEVGAITGKTMTYFPEASSAAQDGKPKAGYTNEGTPNTKMFVSVDVAGGAEGFEKAKQFTDTATVQELGGVGDQAITAGFPDGNVGVIVQRGDAVIRIDWPPAVYGDDAAGMGGRLAELLMGKMFE